MLALIAAALLTATSPDVALRTAEDTGVIVSAQLGETVKPICSGFVAYSRGTRALIVTARHCTRQEPGDDFAPVPTSVQFFDGDVASVTAVARSVDSDVAILTVSSRRRHPYAWLSAATPKRGASMFAFGFAHGEPWSYGPAWFLQGSAYADGVEDIFARTLLMSCPSCGPGSSGGPVYDAAGRVVAIFSGGNAWSMLAVPAPIIARSLGIAAPI